MVAPGPAPRRGVPSGPPSRRLSKAKLKRRRRRRRATRLVFRSFLVLVLAGITGLGTFISGLLAAPIDLSLAPPPTAAILLADDGRQIAEIQPPEKREIVSAAQIPEVMRQAIVSAEDERFFKHNGVDPLSTIRAAFRDITGSGGLQGGSTLTQQYVKNAYVGNERTALRKIREAALAYRLEQRLTKEQILTDYLNALYLGNGLYGVQAASKYYFNVPINDLDLNTKTGKHVYELGLARASMLAGLAPAPSAWNPVKDYNVARDRQTYTLNRMVVNGYITSDQATTAFDKEDVHPLQITPPEAANLAPEFTDYVVPAIKADPHYDEDTFFRGGLRVKTTLDLDLQEAFQQALKEVLPGANEPQAAIVAVDYRNGDVKALATLRRAPAEVDAKGKVVPNHAAILGYQQNGFDLATNALRSTGSTIKTFTLAEALSQGGSLDTSVYGGVTDTIPCKGCPGGAYVVHNSGDGEGGREFTYASALADSINTVYVPLAIKVGRSKVARLAENAGLAPLPPNKQALEGVPNAPSNFLSFGIGGGVDVTPLGEAVGYSTFANGGVHVSPRTFTEVRTNASGTDQGQVLFKVPVSGLKRVVTKKVAADVVSALTDVVQYGTATSVRLPQPVFGKTGTTNNSTDAWFTGCLPQEHVCIATWMGNEYLSCHVGGGRRILGACGGMHDIGGVKGQIFGGTLPAKIFTRAQQIFAQIKQARALQAAGIVPTASPTPTPEATHHYYLPPVTETPKPTPTRTKAVPVPTKTLAPKPSPTVVAPTRAPIIPVQPTAPASPP